MNTNPQHHEDENLSALLDGELTDEQARSVLGRLANDPALQRRFSTYCAIGDLMRGHHDSLLDLTARVMTALEAEPTVLAPMRKKSQQRPLLWLAAATCAAITWGLWNALPQQGSPVPMAALQTPMRAPVDVQPYLAAHQDYAQAVLTPPEMQFTRLSLHGEAR